MTSAVRSLLKKLAERSLVAAGVPDLVRTLRPAAGVVLTYHNVIPDGEEPGGDRSLHLPREEFARHLDLLQETHRVVSLTSLLLGRADEEGRPRAAVTFDDGYRGALTSGLRELRGRGLPCTVFVPPGLLGASAVWWDALANPEQGRLRPAVRRRALAEAHGREEEVRRWAKAGGLELSPQPEHASIVSETFLEDVAAEPDVSVGGHGWSHANMIVLEDGELEEEIRRTRAWLQERFSDITVPWLSLPYGHGDERVTKTALEAGYEGVLTLSGERVPAGPDLREIPRVNVPAGLSPEGFLLKTAGL